MPPWKADAQALAAAHKTADIARLLTLLLVMLVGLLIALPRLTPRRALR